MECLGSLYLKNGVLSLKVLNQHCFAGVESYFVLVRGKGVSLTPSLWRVFAGS